MPTKLIAGNWKMNGLVADGVARARELALRVARQGAGVEVLICPPATILFPIAEEVSGSGLKVGGQDCHAMDSGAFTGEIAAAMLANVGCSYVIVGHSERRQYHAEIDLQVSEKAAAAHRNGISAIVCIGETEEERDAGKTLAVVSRQLAGSLPRGATADNTVVAYEPVWAIGTGRTPTAAEIAEVHAHIRAELAGRAGDPERLRILYGGSMKPTNAVEILSIPNVDGGLVGGASLKVDEFWPIVQAAIR